jgi:hypothetical protein
MMCPPRGEFQLLCIFFRYLMATNNVLAGTALRPLASSSAQRCLELQDIFDKVLNEVFPGYDLSPHQAKEGIPFGQNILAKLARTCKALSDSSLNRLWYSFDDLTPLLKTLPQDAWTMTMDSLFVRSWVLF